MISPHTECLHPAYPWLRCLHCHTMWSGTRHCPNGCQQERHHVEQRRCYLHVDYRAEKELGIISHSQVIVFERIGRRVRVRRCELTDVQTTLVLRDPPMASLRPDPNPKLSDDYMDLLPLTEECVPELLSRLPSFAVLWRVNAVIANPNANLSHEFCLRLLQPVY